MTPELQMHDLVALLEAIETRHFMTGAPLILPRGQIGTVVMTYDGSAFDVEFCDREGRAFALLPVAAAKLIRLHDTAAAAA